MSVRVVFEGSIQATVRGWGAVAGFNPSSILSLHDPKQTGSLTQATLTPTPTPPSQPASFLSGPVCEVICHPALWVFFFYHPQTSHFSKGGGWVTITPDWNEFLLGFVWAMECNNTQSYRPFSSSLYYIVPCLEWVNLFFRAASLLCRDICAGRYNRCPVHISVGSCYFLPWS